MRVGLPGILTLNPSPLMGAPFCSLSFAPEAPSVAAISIVRTSASNRFMGLTRGTSQIGLSRVGADGPCVA